MQKELAIVITSKNRKKMVAECIQSLLDSSYQSMDIYVVDNAGTDGTTEYLKEQFDERIIQIRKEENHGSCDGFNTGFQEALKGQYQYVALCDDDVILAKDAVGELIAFLENHSEVGVVGPKIYKMGTQATLQEYGTYLGWDGEYNLTVKNADRIWSESDYPSFLYVDYVPACFLIMHMPLARKIGQIETDYYAYFEEVDLEQKVVLLGYKIAVDSKAEIWHGMKSVTGEYQYTTYRDYYWNRSRMKFFLRYTPSQQLEGMIKMFLQRLYSLSYEKIYCSQELVQQIVLSAYLDAFAGESAPQEEKVVNIQKPEIFLNKLFANKKSVFIAKYADVNAMAYLLKYCDGDVYLDCSKEELEQIREVVSRLGMPDKQEHVFIAEARISYDLCVEQLFHVRDLQEYNPDYIYFDVFGNEIRSQKDAEYWKNFYNSRQAFIQMILPVSIERAKNLRQKWRMEGKYDFLDKAEQERLLFN